MKVKHTHFLFCVDSPDTLAHLFWDCRSTQTFWNNASQWMSENLALTNITPFSPALCHGLIDNISSLIARHYIYIYIFSNYEIPFLSYKYALSYTPPWKLKNRLLSTKITQPPLGRNELLHYGLLDTLTQSPSEKKSLI